MGKEIYLYALAKQPQIEDKPENRPSIFHWNEKFIYQRATIKGPWKKKINYCDNIYMVWNM